MDANMWTINQFMNKTNERIEELTERIRVLEEHEAYYHGEDTENH